MEITPENVEKKAFQLIEARMKKAMRYWGIVVADKIIEIARRELEEGVFDTPKGTMVIGAYDTGELANTVGRKASSDEVLITFGAEHAEDVEYGLSAMEAKSKVTFKDIREWVIRKQIAEAKYANKVARNILDSIHKNGILPKPYLRRAMAQVEALQEDLLYQHTPNIQKILNGNA